MLRVLDAKQNLETVFALSRRYILNQDHSFKGLKNGYKQFLHAIQPAIPVSHCETVEFITDYDRCKDLIAIFAEKTRLDDFDHIFALDPQSQSRQSNLAEFYYCRLQQIDESLFWLFSLIINIVFSGPSELASGGSSSGAIGCIWLNSRSTWNEQDFIEFLVHELTHNLIFLDEYRYQHYSSYESMFLEQNYALSAILAKKRPLDKVFHSIIVGTEVLLTRQSLLGHPESPKLHPPTSIMLPKVMESIHQLEGSPDVYSLLTPRGKELISFCKKRLEEAGIKKVRLGLESVPHFDNAPLTGNLVYQS